MWISLGNFAGKSANAIESKNQDPWTLEQPSEIQCYQALSINRGGRGLSPSSKFGTDNRYWGVVWSWVVPLHLLIQCACGLRGLASMKQKQLDPSLGKEAQLVPLQSKGVKSSCVGYPETQFLLNESFHFSNYPHIFFHTQLLHLLFSMRQNLLL